MKIHVVMSATIAICLGVSPAMAEERGPANDVQVQSLNQEVKLSSREFSETVAVLPEFDGKTFTHKSPDGKTRFITSTEIPETEQNFSVVSNDREFVYTASSDFKSGEIWVDGVNQKAVPTNGNTMRFDLDPFVEHEFVYQRLEENKVSAADPNGYSAITSAVLVTSPTLLIIAPDPATYTRFRYQTFISEAYVPVPTDIFCPGAPDKAGYGSYFTGDNRGFSAGSTQNKTALDFKFDWLNLTVNSVSKYVGPTRVVYFNAVTGALLSGPSATASTSGMSVTLVGSPSATKMTARLKHDIGNPLCISKGIFYDLTISAMRTGSYTVSGQVQKVPNHEFYVRDSNSSTWTTIYRYENVGFHCLIPLTYCEDPVTKTGAIQ